MCKVRATIQSLTQDKIRALFVLANIDVLEVTAIDNEYSPSLIDTAPWFKVLTSIGTIKIGNRKRVTVIDWTDTDVRHVVTEDHVTKSDSMVHAWSVGKVVNYLIALEQYVTMRASGATEAVEKDDDQEE